MDAQQQAQQQKAAEAQKQAEERRNAMLNSMLSPEAKERLGRIKLVKPEKARMVEDLLLQMAQERRLGGPVEDAQLLQLLNQVSETEKHEVKIAHRSKLDEGWDDDDDGW